MYKELDPIYKHIKDKGLSVLFILDRLSDESGVVRHRIADIARLAYRHSNISEQSIRQFALLGSNGIYRRFLAHASGLQFLLSTDKPQDTKNEGLKFVVKSSLSALERVIPSPTPGEAHVVVTTEMNSKNRYIELALWNAFDFIVHIEAGIGGYEAKAQTTISAEDKNRFGYPKAPERLFRNIFDWDVSSPQSDPQPGISYREFLRHAQVLGARIVVRDDGKTHTLDRTMSSPLVYEDHISHVNISIPGTGDALSTNATFALECYETQKNELYSFNWRDGVFVKEQQ